MPSFYQKTAAVYNISLQGGTHGFCSLVYQTAELDRNLHDSQPMVVEFCFSL
ncbi:MAG: hypothetical protein K8I82_26750 [Anaerolineae bacterium]|nr:hypothetical protein [Anaerolineae bacterium]